MLVFGIAGVEFIAVRLKVWIAVLLVHVVDRAFHQSSKRWSWEARDRCQQYVDWQRPRVP